MSDLKQWAAVENGVVVHGGFDAPQSYVDSYTDVVVDRADRVTPYWYHEGVTTFMDVTGMDPRPTTGWFLSGTTWVDGNPSLDVDRLSIPADGTTAAVVVFQQKGPKAPKNIRFEVNGTPAIESLINNKATIEVTSTTPGDVITITVDGHTVYVSVDV